MNSDAPDALTQPLQETEQALNKALRELHGIFNTAVMGIVLLRHRKIDRCNRRMEELFGFAEGQMTGCSTRVWYDDDETWEFVGKDVYAELAAGREAFRELWFTRKDGSHFWGRLAGRALDLADVYAGSVWIIEDLTIEKAEREELLLARKVFEVNSEAIMVSDASNRIVRVNAAFEAITGYRENEVLGHDPKMLGSGRHNGDFFQAMWKTLRQDGYWEGEIWDKRKDGGIYPKWLAISIIRDDRGAVRNYVANFTDISASKEAADRLAHLAYHDPLTGLPNRLAFELHLSQALRVAQREGRQIALMLIDLDNFKNINDTLGHHVGDAFLKKVATRLRDCVRASDLVARLGGDEFVVVLPEITGPRTASHVAEKINQRLGESTQVAEHILYATPSIGISLYPGDGDDAGTLLRNADLALYRAKDGGGGQHCLYEPGLHAEAEERRKLEASLRKALERDEFILHYQPVVDADSETVVSFEALVRWNSKDHGMVSPVKFVPLAEDTRLIVPIGAWVLGEACRQARAWQDAGLPPTFSWS